MAVHLTPGMKLPFFVLPSAVYGAERSTLGDQGKHQIILLLPGEINTETLTNLNRFNENLHAFSELNTSVIVILTGAGEAVTRLVDHIGLGFTILVNSSASVAAFGKFPVVSDTLPVVLIVDGEGVISSVYEGERYPSLPNPLAVLRAVRRLESAPRPHPVASSDWRTGPVDALVVLIEYSDYQCPHCIQLHKIIHQVMEQFEGKIVLVHRHLPLRHSHPLAQQAAEAAEAAGAQGKFWEMHNRLMSADCFLEREDLIRYAGEIGLDLPRFIADVDNRTFQAEVDEDFRQAVENLIKLPPSLFLNSVLLDAPVSLEILTGKIRSILG